MPWKLTCILEGWTHNSIHTWWKKCVTKKSLFKRNWYLNIVSFVYKNHLLNIHINKISTSKEIQIFRKYAIPWLFGNFVFKFFVILVTRIFSIDPRNPSKLPMCKNPFPWKPPPLLVVNCTSIGISGLEEKILILYTIKYWLKLMYLMDETSNEVGYMNTGTSKTLLT